ncbi:helix-turn-helix domain-containing protein [Massiliimalia timonensis]|uniref:helix-turn-helix domain-containing protein n=1 Tax=Massiliimalia timonensis TaxID=1987501 RepID=UPI00189FD0B9|nr:helix-turn-helix transcriptional regulator [Massiliimalia timonensis]
MDFGLKLKSLRENANMTQSEVAQKMNVLQTSISKYELGINEPDFETLVKFADLFNVNIDYFLDHTEVKTSWKDLNRIISINKKNYSFFEIMDMLVQLPEKDKICIINIMERFKQYNEK